ERFHSAEWILLEFSGLFYYSVIKFRKHFLIVDLTKLHLSTDFAPTNDMITPRQKLVNNFFILFFS
ncbi:MAG: hypothetical protein K2K70_05060, partial [Lachnospiraceae bacterium]|nr:hypothetical protein [Lachnospiraceae bacterium]